MNKVIYMFIAVTIFGGAVLYGLLSSNNADEELLSQPTPVPLTESPTPQQPAPSPTQTTPFPLDEAVIHIVPFISQAPLAQWENPMFQDGCEEASILMAAAWAGAVDSERIASPKRASVEITDLSEYQRELDGEFRDRSAEDTAQLMKQYFDYPNIRFEPNIIADDIIRELIEGNIIIIPANGQMLKNPHFTPPGPERHMLVIRGWDPSTNEFITNDPGTRFGEGYRYNETVLYNAIRDYHTGYHVPIETIEKSMIAVAKP